MDPDLALSIGAVIGVFSIPSILSALSESRAPRASAVMILLGGGLILYALQTKPGGYRMDEIPHVFATVVSRFMP
ncbi:MAG: hypothetical protein P8N14_14385 [Sulfitobacter sp.]|jgi:hypothetical protein|nr:hypothetical protein [Sulfitobacter sp.]